MTRDEFLRYYTDLVWVLDELLGAADQPRILPGEGSSLSHRKIKPGEPEDEEAAGALVDMVRNQHGLPDLWRMVRGCERVRDPSAHRYGPPRGGLHATDEEIAAWGLSTEEYLDDLVHPWDA